MPYTVTFWGTRGTIPTPGAHTVRYGGNTACVAVETADAVVVLDAGTGIRGLGAQLVERQNGSIRAEILLSHTHWDHIQGLPHFKPFFAEGNEVRIRASQQGAATLESILRLQMHPAVFPVPLDALSARLAVEQITPGEFTVGPFAVRAIRLRHPGTTLGYRLTPLGGGASLAYVTDNELGTGGDYDLPATWRQAFVEFLAGADVVIHDAMYTPAQLERHRGWGHSTYDEALTVAVEAGVRRLVLFHHEPEHGDDTMDGLVAEARRLAGRMGGATEVAAAQEGMRLTL
jgi:phosphoribosyl 1,2-cyclic phosphodiesterase